MAGTLDGSSPLSRGIPSTTQPNALAAWIIPTLAGNTRPRCRACPPRRDHPHSRGEYFRWNASSPTEPGSSPLSRGILAAFGTWIQTDRIIPTLAGNTERRARCTRAPRDHPHSRGEYSWRASSRMAAAGSSPLSRGILAPTPRVLWRTGIIPTLAGNTPRRKARSASGTDHPHSRGEYMRVKHPVVPNYGSSPLSRGIPAPSSTSRWHHGIIPTLAGNTLVDKGFYQLDLSDLGNPLLARLRFSKSLAPRLRRPSSWRGESSGSSPEGPGRTIRVSPS